MAESKIITLSEVGDVLLERSYRAKHIIISVKSPSKIRVAVPVGIDFEKAHKFAEQKEYWIEKQLAKFSDSTAIPILDTFACEDLVARKKYLTKRVDDLAKQHGFKYNKLRFKVMKTRWGIWWYWLQRCSWWWWWIFCFIIQRRYINCWSWWWWRRWC